MRHLREGLEAAVDVIVQYRESLPDAVVGSLATRGEVVDALPTSLPDGPAALDVVLKELVAVAEPGLVASAGPRYFGFVVGGSTDVALMADVVAVGWDQMAFNEVSSPAALAFEDVAGSWLKQILGIPASASTGFVTGAQAANTVGLAAARWQVLQDHGWDVGKDGLHGAPKVTVIVGAERHATIDRSLRFLGLGEHVIEVVPAREDGAMDAEALDGVMRASRFGPLIVCAQAGNVNTGAFDDLRRIAELSKSHGAWLHVDGAFGLWAGASSHTRHLVDGIELCGLLGMRRPQVVERALRLRIRVLRSTRGSRHCNGLHRRVLDGSGVGSPIRWRRLRARIVATCPRVRYVGSAAVARPDRCGASSRPMLRVGPSIRGWTRRH